MGHFHDKCPSVTEGEKAAVSKKRGIISEGKRVDIS